MRHLNHVGFRQYSVIVVYNNPSGGTFRFHQYQYETGADDHLVMITCTVIIQARFSTGT